MAKVKKTNGYRVRSKKTGKLHGEFDEKSAAKRRAKKVARKTY